MTLTTSVNGISGGGGGSQASPHGLDGQAPDQDTLLAAMCTPLERQRRRPDSERGCQERKQLAVGRPLHRASPHTDAQDPTVETCHFGAGSAGHGAETHDHAARDGTYPAGRLGVRRGEPSAALPR